MSDSWVCALCVFTFLQGLYVGLVGHMLYEIRRQEKEA